MPSAHARRGIITHTHTHVCVCCVCVVCVCVVCVCCVCVCVLCVCVCVVCVCNIVDVLLLWKSTISKELTKVNREADFDAIVQRAGDHNTLLDGRDYL